MSDLSIVLQELMASAVLFFPKILVSMVILAISFLVAALIGRSTSRLMRTRHVDPEIGLLISQVSRWAVIVLGLTMALQQLNFNLSAFLTSLGILGFTVGFAIQDVSKNLIAGLLLLLQQPFDIGDIIEVSGYSGRVTRVDLRATEINTFDGNHVMIPNGDVFTSPILNYSRTPRRRIKLKVGVAYDSDLDQVERIVLDTIGKVAGIYDEPLPKVIFDNFGESSIDLTVYFWVDTAQSDVLRGTTSAIKAIKIAFENAGIDIPFPMRVVQMEEKLKSNR